MGLSSGHPEQFTLYLPQELINSVVDCVRDDRRALTILGLVSSAWHLQTRIHLFHEIALGKHSDSLANNKAQCERLYYILVERPELCTLIKWLSLTDYRYWFCECPEIARTLPLLTSPTEITLQHIDWSRCSVGLQIKLDSLMARPTLTKLSLGRVDNIDLVPLAQYHNLEDLTMQNVRPCSKTSFPTGACFPLNSRMLLDSPPPDDVTQASKLCITLGQCGEALKTLLLCAADSEATLPLLRPSEIMLMTEGFEQVIQKAWTLLLDHCAPSIVGYSLKQNESMTYIWHPPTLPPFIPATLPLRRFPRLEYVVLSPTYYHLRSQSHQMMPCLIHELEGIRAGLTTSGKSSNLTHIAFIIKLTASDDELRSAMLEIANEPGWRELDRLLMDSSFARIAHVHFAFIVDADTPRDGPGLQMEREVIFRGMENLSSKGAVTVKLGAGVEDLYATTQG